MPEVRDRVVRAAVTLFARKGFEATTVREVVAEAGVTKGALYHYFDSKEDLLVEVYRTMQTAQRRRMEAIADSDLDLPTRLHTIIADVVETTIADLDEAVVFFQSFHLLDPTHQNLVRAERRAYHDRVKALVEEGQRAGVFRADIPATVVVNYHFGAVHRLGLWYRPDGPLSPEELGLHFADMTLASLAPPT
ncbi:TetR/AcrR family transcriptional regulator [Actinokineospora bangkokensis]|uniref:TetR family transcriptional regulator n=1 Tax=Actinokineospora bangkokensis TaxID=1193682 RepID=A0A1Q9LLU4_9PSEU|nr:TetR/AcrR family transcriptional regulator [Actinokineospora bangkokensis]OLR92985.1 TetR family transcriptional regulator [Actinokineospora bangkokensis]